MLWYGSAKLEIKIHLVFSTLTLLFPTMISAILLHHKSNSGTVITLDINKYMSVLLEGFKNIYYIKFVSFAAA